MSDIVIQVEKISKKYTLHHQCHDRYTALRDVLANSFKSVGKRVLRQFTGQGHQPRMSREEFYALQDVSFEVRQGDRVGIIGRNGAGKSTLLKVLSRITEPTSGWIGLNGRVASLLEVGTGFHPELTGRENIFLNGAILGMGRTEIKRKFDEIVDFANVERFLDTPVKRYSSGMYVRLAFAVAAHLEPEILIVDEVLAVGDAQFQKKCLGKMQDVGREGRTVLFVSHQMGSIANLCSSALLLDRGRIVKSGEVKETIEYYMNNLSASTKQNNIEVTSSDKDIYFSKVESLNARHEQASDFLHDEEVVISVTCKVNKWIAETVMGFYVTDHKGRRIFTNMNNLWPATAGNSEEILSTVTIPGNFLVPGQYSFTFAISVEHAALIDIMHDALEISIIDAGTQFSSYEGHDYGCVFADCKWNIVENN